jgi:uncharacterized metal-binding protein YceD (DUF177 family)
MTAAPEFSRPIAIEGIIPDKPRLEDVEATVEECAALAERFDLQSLSSLKAKLKILRVSDGNILRVEGDLEAEVVQTCVVSLQGVPAEIKAHFDTYFTEGGKEGLEGEELLHIDVEEEFPDLIVSNGQLDMGELVAQYLALELDPYPRAPGVSLAAQLTELGGEAKNRPFHVLKNLKTDEDK